MNQNIIVNEQGEEQQDAPLIFELSIDQILERIPNFFECDPEIEQKFANFVTEENFAPDERWLGY